MKINRLLITLAALLAAVAVRAQQFGQRRVQHEVRPAQVARDLLVPALDADLVVDAAGSGSRAPQWLDELGFARPRETVVNGFLGYSTRFVRPPANWKCDWKTLYIQCAPPARKRGGLIASVEGGRWIVTLCGGGKDYPPTDEDEFRAFARSLADPRFAEAYEASEPLSPIVRMS